VRGQDGGIPGVSLWGQARVYTSRAERLSCYHNDTEASVNTATAITIAGLAALTPTVTCLIGIILSRQDIRDLRGEIGSLRPHVDAELGKIRADMQQFYSITGKLDGRLDEISKK